MSLVSWWNLEGEKYITIGLNDREFCDVKRTEDQLMCVMIAGNGLEVYEDDADNGIRMLSESETEEVIRFADQCFRRN